MQTASDEPVGRKAGTDSTVVDLQAIAAEVKAEQRIKLTPDFKGRPAIRELVKYLAFEGIDRKQIAATCETNISTFNCWVAGAQTPNEMAYEIILRIAKAVSETSS